MLDLFMVFFDKYFLIYTAHSFSIALKLILRAEFVVTFCGKSLA